MSAFLLPDAFRAFVVSGLLCPVIATAASLPFRDGFESGDLSTWEKTWFPSAANTLAPSAEAAKVGAFGLRLVDEDASSGPQGQNSVHIDLGSNFNQLSTRTWIRMSNPAGQGSLTVITLPNGAGQTMLSVVVDIPSGAVSLALVAANSPFTERPTGTSLQPGTWHLIELLGSGIGTVNGQARLWVDGEPRASLSNLDWSAMRPVGFNFGAHWSGGASTSIVDFDEVALATALQASRVRLDPMGVTTLEAGACAPIELRITTSTGTAVTDGRGDLPVSLAATTEAGGKAAFYASADCATPIDALLIPPSNVPTIFYVRPTHAGRLEIAATTDDLLPGRLQLIVDGPVARVTPGEQAVDPGAAVTLDASTSTGGMTGAPAGYEWKLVQGPRGVAFAEGAVQSLRLEVPGRYEAQLVVTDSQGRRSLPKRAVIDVRGEPALPDGDLTGCSQAPASASFLVALCAGWLSRRRRDAR